MFELYTDRCRRVWMNAQAEAYRLGSPGLGNEHVLLAIAREAALGRPTPTDPSEAVIREHECLAGLALSRHGITAESLGEELCRQLRIEWTATLGSAASYGATAGLPSTTGVTQSIAVQRRQVRLHDHVQIDTAMQLLGTSTASLRVRRVLRALGLPARRVAGAMEAVAAERAELDAQARTMFTASELAAWTIR